MWVAELGCAQGHGFEGFFGSRDDFEAQQARGLVRCPVCDSAQVSRRLSAPRLNLGAEAPVKTPQAPAPADERARLRELLAQLRARSEDLGSGFAAEARRIHHGEAPERAIRGQASGDEFAALLDEGIAVLPLPDPDSLAPTH